MIGKRIFDLAFVVPGVIILSPLFFVISFLVKYGSNGPVFFRQIRVGQFEKPFHVFKFRTMVIDAEALGAKVTVGHDPRITRIGYFLRKYKLDELPQLINVLKGEMSLVGPRPEVPEYVAHWPEKTRKRVLSVPPGITDYASIEFREESDLLKESKDPVGEYINEIIPIKLRHYERYVEDRSLWLDLKLIFRTLVVILR